MSDDRWPLQTFAERTYWLLHHLCPFWLVIDRRECNQEVPEKEKWDEWRAGWLAGSSILLFGMWLYNPSSDVGMAIFAAIAAWRLLEIFTTGLGTALLQKEQARARSLVTIGVYGLQLILIFAILYHSLATTAFVADSGPAGGAFDYLYISWSNITSLGNEIYIPASDMARLLEVMTTTAGVLLLGVLLAFGIDAVKDHDSRAEAEATKPPQSQQPSNERR